MTTTIHQQTGDFINSGAENVNISAIPAQKNGRRIYKNRINKGISNKPRSLDKKNKYSINAWASLVALIFSLSSLVCVTFAIPGERMDISIIIASLALITTVLLAKQLIDAVSVNKMINSTKQELERMANKLALLELLNNDNLLSARIYSSIINCVNPLQEPHIIDHALIKMTDELAASRLINPEKSAILAEEVLRRFELFYDFSGVKEVPDYSSWFKDHRKCIINLLELLPREKRKEYEHLTKDIVND